jgi:hypothetical protein
MADAETLIEVPTVALDGDADAEFHDAQLNVLPLMRAEPASAGGVVHCMSTVTFVVACPVTLKVAEPVQVVRPSVVVPVIAML